MQPVHQYRYIDWKTRLMEVGMYISIYYTVYYAVFFELSLFHIFVDLLVTQLRADE